MGSRRSTTGASSRHLQPAAPGTTCGFRQLVAPTPGSAGTSRTNAPTPRLTIGSWSPAPSGSAEASGPAEIHPCDLSQPARGGLDDPVHGQRLAGARGEAEARSLANRARRGRRLARATDAPSHESVTYESRDGLRRNGQGRMATRSTLMMRLGDPQPSFSVHSPLVGQSCYEIGHAHSCRLT